MKKSTKNIPISIIYEKFNFIQEGSIIINTSRGGLIDEQEVFNAAFALEKDYE